MSTIEQKALECAIGEARAQAVNATHRAFDQFCRQVGIGNWPAHERSLAEGQPDDHGAHLKSAGVKDMLGIGASPTVEFARDGTHDSGEMPAARTGARVEDPWSMVKLADKIERARRLRETAQTAREVVDKVNADALRASLKAAEAEAEVHEAITRLMGGQS